MQYGGTQNRSTEEYVDITDVHRVEWPTEGGSTPVSALVTAIADLNGCDPLNLPPLRERIDPEALNRLFSSNGASTVDHLTFYYCGYEVVVQQTEIRLRTPGGS
ncbi:hypothetical protein OB955_15180 [Halobacteria archaeon AArc-m2/3/4]|uniref:Halobacterial output domain-containing protein n=1 Tax=Natronoglomus mannanivorans TaxID=2979990 RepID=A0AAP3E4D2_9EURY|nr:hypothetical protein [Halobacteria archaeon AArc-xg1-1]MCU4974071.1 hypothetical protein [Halobacteria archaeon AArc-m2/3/4]